MQVACVTVLKLAVTMETTEAPHKLLVQQLLVWDATGQTDPLMVGLTLASLSVFRSDAHARAHTRSRTHKPICLVHIHIYF